MLQKCYFSPLPITENIYNMLNEKNKCRKSFDTVPSTKLKFKNSLSPTAGGRTHEDCLKKRNCRNNLNALKIKKRVKNKKKLRYLLGFFKNRNGITDFVPTTSDMHALKTSLAGWSDYSRIFITGNQPNKISLIQETANMQLVCMNIKKCWIKKCKIVFSFKICSCIFILY